MPEVAHQPLRPLSEEEMTRLRREKRAREQGEIERGLGLWPDIRESHEKNQQDITQITRDIARGS